MVKNSVPVYASKAERLEKLQRKYTRVQIMIAQQNRKMANNKAMDEKGEGTDAGMLCEAVGR